jgi:hypothetical protein
MIFRHLCLLGVLVLPCAFSAEQQVSSSGSEPSPLEVPNPQYVTMSESVVVDAPVDKVWTRVGKFCDIMEWMNSPEWEDRRYLQGDRGPGSVRSIVNEVLVGETQYSYTYAQPPRKNTSYNLAHGTVSAEAITPTITRLSYTMMRDDSLLSDYAARQHDAESRHARCAEWLKNMKVLVEGGRLPPKPTGNLRPPITTI